jgi:hypothetical protein
MGLTNSMRNFRFSISFLFVFVAVAAVISIFVSNFVNDPDRTLVGDWVYPSSVDNGVLGTAQRLRITEDGGFELLVFYRDSYHYFSGNCRMAEDDFCKIRITNFKSSENLDMEDFKRTGGKSMRVELRYKIEDGVLSFDIPSRQAIKFHGFPIRFQRYSRSLGTNNDGFISFPEFLVENKGSAAQ